MLYSPKYNLLFVAVPKTGTTSFTRALGNVLEARRNVLDADGADLEFGEHDPLSVVASKSGWERVDGMMVVGAVRNPWDRLVSSYHFYRNGRVAGLVLRGKQRSPMAILNVIAAKLMPFSIWVRFYRTKSCYSYLSDKDGRLRANFVMRMETLGDDVKALCDRLGIERVELSHDNQSSRSGYRTYYSDTTRKLVEHRFQDDVRAFDYSF